MVPGRCRHHIGPWIAVTEIESGHPLTAYFNLSWHVGCTTHEHEWFRRNLPNAWADRLATGSEVSGGTMAGNVTSNFEARVCDLNRIGAPAAPPLLTDRNIAGREPGSRSPQSDRIQLPINPTEGDKS
jgi:hypothetical protein